VPFRFRVLACGPGADFLLADATALRDLRPGPRVVPSVDGASARSPIAQSSQRFSRLNTVDSAHEVRHHCLEIGEERSIRARPGQIVRIERDRHDRLVPQRRLSANVSVRAADDRSTGERLAAFRAHQIHQCHEHAVLLGDVTRQTLPALEVGGDRTFVLAPPYTPGGGSRQNEDRGRSVERRYGSGETVPGVFADEHRRAAPMRVESAHLEAAIDESFLVEHPVCRQEELPMHVPDNRLIASQRHIERAIIVGVVPHLVEPNAHIERPRCINRRGVLQLQVAGECARAHRDVADATFNEVSR